MLYEVPYNFDKEIIRMYYILQRDLEIQYSSIYMPAFWEDDHSVIRNTYQGNSLKALTRDEYISHVKAIQEYFPDKIMVLLQQRDNVLTEDILKFYFDLGITRFCVNGLDKAKLIKSMNSKAFVACSLTAKLTPEDIIKNEEIYKKYYDNIILFWYPFNRNLNIIKRLPTSIKYTLLANACCSMTCGGVIHWLNPETDGKCIDEFCPTRQRGFNKIEDSTLIDPRHTKFFEKYIYSFKFQDRGDSTGRLLGAVWSYEWWPYKCYLNEKEDRKLYELDNYTLNL